MITYENNIGLSQEITYKKYADSAIKLAQDFHNIIENMKNKYQSEFWLDSNYNTQELLNSNFSSRKP